MISLLIAMALKTDLPDAEDPEYFFLSVSGVLSSRRFRAAPRPRTDEKSALSLECSASFNGLRCK